MDTDRKKKIISSGRVTAEDLKKGDIDPNKSYIFDFENKDQKKDNKQDVSQNDPQKKLSELKQEVENLKEKEKQARKKEEDLNLKIYSKKDKNGQPMADEDIRKQFYKAFDEWSKINREYQKKLAEYKMAERENKKKQQRKNENFIKENLNQTIYSDGVNTYRGKEARQAYNKHLEDKENKEEQKKASATKHNLKQMRAFIKQQIEQSARSKESYKNNKSNPLDLGKAKMTNEKRETRKADKPKSRKTKPLINERKQKHINNLYEQMTIKNINNNKSRNNMQSINQQLEANKRPRKNIDNNISRSSILNINAQKAKKKGKTR